MKILITGGAGFVGSHLVDALIEKKYKAVVIDNLSTGKKENINPGAKFYKADISSPEIHQIFKKEKPDTVFHFAAQVDVVKSVKNPLKDANINILGSLNLIGNFLKGGLLNRRKKFIFASSVGVYGEPRNLPVDELHLLNPIVPYSITKLAVEKYLNFFQNQGLEFVSLRYSNIYGPRQLTSGEGGVIAIFIDRILRNKKIIIFGNGRQTRDFLYIDDAVDAAILAMEKKQYGAYNIGTNREITVNNALRLITKILDEEANISLKPFRQGEIIKSRICYSKIRKELGWLPKYNLEKGLRETTGWFENNLYRR